MLFTVPALRKKAERYRSCIRKLKIRRSKIKKSSIGKLKAK